jgi:hypothetical protein
MRLIERLHVLFAAWRTSIRPMDDAHFTRPGGPACDAGASGCNPWFGGVVASHLLGVVDPFCASVSAEHSLVKRPYRRQRAARAADGQAPAARKPTCAPGDGAGTVGLVSGAGTRHRRPCAADQSSSGSTVFALTSRSGVGAGFIR